LIIIWLRTRYFWLCSLLFYHIVPLHTLPFIFTFCCYCTFCRLLLFYTRCYLFYVVILHYICSYVCVFYYVLFVVVDYYTLRVVRLRFAPRFVPHIQRAVSVRRFRSFTCAFGFLLVYYTHATCILALLRCGYTHCYCGSLGYAVPVRLRPAVHGWFIVPTGSALLPNTARCGLRSVAGCSHFV